MLSQANEFTQWSTYCNIKETVCAALTMCSPAPVAALHSSYEPRTLSSSLLSPKLLSLLTLTLLWLCLFSQAEILINQWYKSPIYSNHSLAGYLSFHHISVFTGIRKIQVSMKDSVLFSLGSFPFLLCFILIECCLYITMTVMNS